jgi:undecaprenyl phosphate-alpha-L-ara4N flippase subunit ArnF
MQHGDSLPSFGWTFVASVVDSLSTADFLLLGLGILLYGISLVLWTIALTRYPVSVAYPLLSISYILVYLAATQLTVLNEPASLSQSTGVAIIVIGVWFLSRESRVGR